MGWKTVGILSATEACSKASDVMSQLTLAEIIDISIIERIGVTFTLIVSIAPRLIPVA